MGGAVLAVESSNKWLSLSAFLEGQSQAVRCSLCTLILQSCLFGMYGPPPRRKRKVRIAGQVCAYVYGLVGVFNDPGPGWNALRSVPI